MAKEYRDDPTFTPWGPFISKHYVNEGISQGDIIVASIVWALTLINAIIAIYIAYGQTRSSREPLRSVYVWMIWLELLVSFIMGFECFLHLLKVIRPSFAFYFTILFWWCIQVQLLLQIIINRIRVILTDRNHSKMIMIGVAVIVTLINISVFNIWIPARLQVSHRYKVINEYWDRTEKVLYLLIDGALNWYFLKTVKANLINNGLTKYNKLVKFNQKIVVLSLCMDVMIIAAMSIPNSFVYIQFHPLAYLVKLNIEMTMANLIKRIAISTSRKAGKHGMAQEFKTDSGLSQPTIRNTGRRSSAFELSTIVSCNAETKEGGERTVSFAAMGRIKQTNEIIVRNEPNPFYEQDVERQGEEKAQELVTVRPKSLESFTEGNDSVRSAELPKMKDDASEDEEALFEGRRVHGWR